MCYMFGANTDIYCWRIFNSILFHSNVLSLQKKAASVTKVKRVHKHTLARVCTPAVKTTVQQSRDATRACVQRNVRAAAGAQGRSVSCWTRDQVLNLSSDPAAKTTSRPRTFRHAAAKAQFLRGRCAPELASAMAHCSALQRTAAHWRR